MVHYIFIIHQHIFVTVVYPKISTHIQVQEFLIHDLYIILHLFLYVCIVSMYVQYNISNLNFFGLDTVWI